METDGQSIRRSYRKKKSPTEWWKSDSRAGSLEPRNLSVAFAQEDAHTGRGGARHESTNECTIVRNPVDSDKEPARTEADVTASPTVADTGTASRWNEPSADTGIGDFEAHGVSSTPRKNSVQSASLHQGWEEECTPPATRSLFMPNFNGSKALPLQPGAPKKLTKPSSPCTSPVPYQGVPLTNPETASRSTDSTPQARDSINTGKCQSNSVGDPEVTEETSGLCLVARRAMFKYSLVRGQSGYFKVATGLALDTILGGELLLPGHSSTGVRVAHDCDEFYIVRRGVIECDYSWARVRMREGDMIAIPHATCFELRNVSSVEAVLTFLSSNRCY